MYLTKVDKGILVIAPYTQVYNLCNLNGHELSGAYIGVTEVFRKYCAY